jgi:hypothetical protein
MNVICPQCSKEFKSGFPAICPDCKKMILSEDDIKNRFGFSIEGVALLYIQRVKGKIFGPFPSEKIKTLVKQGKIVGHEKISQDKEIWHLVSDVKEFDGLLGKVEKNSKKGNDDLPGLKSDAKSSPDLPGLKSKEQLSPDLPGLKSSPKLSPDLPSLKSKKSNSPDLPSVKKDLPSISSDLPGEKNNLPGVRSDLPGIRSDLPGVRNNLPGVRSDLPGIRSDLPGVRNDLPGVRSDLPGIRNDLPGVRSDLPGVRNDLPDLRSDLPGARNDLPSVRSDLPGARNDLPGVRSDLPGVRNDLPADSDDLVDITDSKDGISISQSGLSDNSNSGSSLGSSEDVQENRSSNSLELDLEKDSSLLGGNSLPVFDSLIPDDDSEDGIPLLNPFSEQVTLPLSEDRDEDENTLLASVESDSLDYIDEEQVPTESSSNIALIGGIVVLLLVVFGAVWFFNIGGFFGSDNKEEKNRVEISNKKKPKIVKSKVIRKKVIKKKRKKRFDFLFEFEKVKVQKKIGKDKKISCLSSLLLVFHHHDYSQIDQCKFIVARVPKKSADLTVTIINIFRLLIIDGDYPEEIKTKVWSGPALAKTTKTLDTIVSQALSRNRKSSIWNMIAGYVSFSKGDDKRAKIHLLMAKTQEPDFILALNYYLTLLGDEESKKLLLKEVPVWGVLADNINYLRSITKRGFFPLVGLKRKILKSSVINLKEFGKKFDSLEKCSKAYNAWANGKIDIALKYCNKAVISDRYEEISGTICMGLWKYHGLYGNISKFYGKVKLRWTKRESLYANLAFGKKIRALQLWRDLKSINDNHYVFAAPWIVVSSEPGGFILKDTIKKSWELDKVKAALVLVYIAWFKPTLSSKLVVAFNSVVKDKDNIIFKNTMAAIESIASFSKREWEKTTVSVNKLKDLSKGAYLPFKSLESIALSNLGKSKPASDWMKQISGVELTARGAASIIYGNIISKNFIDAYRVINKIENLMLDQIFFSFSTRAYLKGKRKDRLLRAKYFIDKIIKIAPESIQNKVLMGRILIESGKYEVGEKIMEETMLSPLTNIYDLYEWIDMEIRLKRFKATILALEMGVKKFPNNSEIYFKFAKLYSERNNPKKAIKFLEKIKENNSLKSKKYFLLGKNYMKLRMKKEAEKSFALAVKNPNSNSEANFQYGRVLIGNSRVKKSIIFLKKAMEKVKLEKNSNKNNSYEWLSEAHRLLGGAYKELGQKKNAVYHFRKYAQMVEPGPLKDEAMRMLRILGAD